MDIPKVQVIASLVYPRERLNGMTERRSEVLQGTLDLMILKTLHALGPLASGRLPTRRPDHHDRAGDVEQSDACSPDYDPTCNQYGRQDADGSGTK